MSILSKQQIGQLKDLRTKYAGNQLEKFAVDPQGYEVIAGKVAQGLGLDKSPQRIILDLGCGLGFFVRVCKMCGHVVSGLDLPNPLIVDASNILGVSILAHEMCPNQRLPIWRLDFDLITMFGVNLHDGTDYWDAPKYAFLAADIRFRLQPGGSWVIRPNAPVGQNSPTACLMDPAWWQEVAGPDAEITTTINHSFQVTVKWKP